MPYVQKAFVDFMISTKLICKKCTAEPELAKREELMRDYEPQYPYDALDLEEVHRLQKEIAKTTMQLWSLLADINTTSQQIRSPVTAARAARKCNEHTDILRELRNKVAVLCKTCGVQD